jgi:small subunit ribosomal protein S20
MRQNARRRARNLIKKNAIRTAEKKFRKAIAAQKADEAREALRTLQKLLDKAAKTGVMHKNAASRAKSRFAKAFAAVSAKH